MWSTITPTGGNPGSWQFHPSLIDASRNRWVHLNEFNYLQSIDLTTSGSTQVAISGALTAIDDYSAVVHDLDNDRYITVQGTSIYAINPVTGVSTLLGTVPAAVNGIHNRLAYFKELGGIAYLPGFSSNILFMPTR